MQLNKIHLIDALAGLKGISDKYLDCIIADPPYNIGKNFGNNFDNLNLQDYISWCKEWFAECWRTLKDTGTIFIYADAFVSPYIFVSIETLNKRTLIWHYKNKNSPNNKFWQRSYESIICVWKDQRIFNIDAVREPYTETFLENAAGKKRASTKGRFGNQPSIYQAHEGGALPRDVICTPALAGGAGRAERFFYCKECNNIFTLAKRIEHKNHELILHPTQKSLAISNKLISSCKPPQGIVCIPFCGTGVEVLATKKMGMDFIAFEINPDYYQMATKLIELGKFPKANNEN